MFISKKQQTNKYPFTAGSDMQLAPGVYLGNGIVVASMLYPHCDATDYAYISYIGRVSSSFGLGRIEVSSAAGEVIAAASDISYENLDDYTTVTFTDKLGVVCGTLTFTKELKPILLGCYKPSPTAFVFTPSAFRPIPTAVKASLLYADQPVESVIFRGGSIYGNTVGKVHLDTNSIAGQLNPINCIVLQGGTTYAVLGGTATVSRSVAILPYTKITYTVPNGAEYKHTGSCIRVANTGTEIRVGTLSDVRK